VNQDFSRARFTKGVTPLLLLLALGVTACNNNSSSSLPPSAKTTIDTFSGTVAVGGSDAHNFTVTTSSEVDVTLTAATPPDGVVMGIGVGSLNGSTCVPFTGATATTAAGTSVQLAGGLSPGTFCVVVYDVGNQTAPVTYTVTVSHK
jgi:hypothetical protein